MAEITTTIIVTFTIIYTCIYPPDTVKHQSKPQVYKSDIAYCRNRLQENTMLTLSTMKKRWEKQPTSTKV